MKLTLSNLPKTWIFDLDGTLVVHNGYLHGGDKLLPGVKELFETIPERDFILILTARKEEYMDQTKRFLANSGLRYNFIINDIPMGERLLFNDNKPSGLKMAFAINQVRDQGCEVHIDIDQTL